ncbi:sulfite dehydrogenase [Dinoroseobacter sp. PD6]|uniref:sulfite dehydrogenase n=1 Tax=Dinoroseobacter sp. PD6 TaxID=3028384 RepID=UPI00237B32B7|nr:sulfite dehydrogenase [Dinoroseobacter sp. PD6]MDD9717919.1 sulfite dehydrogenase [Dinoroseobacter sp. PD6]
MDQPEKSSSRLLASSGRRAFLGASAGLGAAAVAGLAARAAPLAVPESNRTMGDPIPETDYGMPIEYEDHVRRRRTDVFVNRQNYSDWSMTPLHQQLGIATPNGLFFERHHNGVARIDPDVHRVAIHGMVRQPLLFSMDDLMRYPSVSRFHFLECSGNGLTDWREARSTTVQQSHGLLSCAQWTGIPLSWLLDEAGLQDGASWVVLEGADGSGHLRSIPIDKIMDDALLAYGQNGEMLRAEQGYPVRAILPGWEGNTNVKWLRRIYVTDEPLHVRGETARYTDPMPDGKWRQFSMEMEAKSVITNPSGGMRLPGPGPVELSGFAWSGNGTISHVDVTVDGGRSWVEAQLEGPVMEKCLTRFRFRWNWDGTPAKIASRAVDSTGYVQPTAEQLARVREISGFVQHNNAIFPWTIDSNGEVGNAIA